MTNKKTKCHGKVFLVGAGPGDPRLFTLRGRDVLEKADTVVYDRLIPRQVLQWARPEADRIYAGKSPKRHTLTQEQINSLLIRRAKAGELVVRLKGGDPFIFGRGGEEALSLAEAGVNFEVVPGITAAAGACAYAGIPLTHRGLSGSAALITGHDSADSDGGHDWEALAHFSGTLVFYMTVANLNEICRSLVSAGKNPAMPAVIIENGTCSAQRTIRGSLQNIVARAEAHNVAPPAILVTGRVAGMDETLAWFENLPLFSKKVVITRSTDRAGEMADCVLALGGEPVLAPAIKTVAAADTAPLESALRRLGEFDLVIFTSSAGVDAVFRQLSALGGDARRFGGVSVCAIGPKTAGRLNEYGISADIVPPTYTTEGVIGTLTAREQIRGRSILYPRSGIAPPRLVDLLSDGGADVEAVEAYSVARDGTGMELVKELLVEGQGEDVWLTFSSASTVENFFAMISPTEISASGAAVASIGPGTSGALDKIGMPPKVEAKEHTAKGLVSAIAHHLTATTDNVVRKG